MKRIILQTCLEAAILLGLSATVALLVNAVRADGVSLTRDYFLIKTTTPDAPLSDQPPEHGFQTVSLEEAYDNFELSDSAIVFIDARDDDHYNDGHITGAIQFNYYHPERYLGDVLAYALDAEIVIIYCNGGTCEDSILAAQYLTSEIETPLDFETVYVFEGGMTEWRAADYPTEKEGGP